MNLKSTAANGFNFQINNKFINGILGPGMTALFMFIGLIVGVVAAE